jgi:hypothetical protein
MKSLEACRRRSLEKTKLIGGVVFSCNSAFYIRFQPEGSG